MPRTLHIKNCLTNYLAEGCVSKYHYTTRIPVREDNFFLPKFVTIQGSPTLVIAIDTTDKCYSHYKIWYMPSFNLTHTLRWQNLFNFHHASSVVLLYIIVFFQYVLSLCQSIPGAGTRKGPKKQTLLKGTDKILIMLKSIPRNFRDQLHSSCAKFLLIIFLACIASAITLDINTSQISRFQMSIDSATAGFIVTN